MASGPTMACEAIKTRATPDQARGRDPWNRAEEVASDARFLHRNLVVYGYATVAGTHQSVPQREATSGLWTTMITA